MNKRIKILLGWLITLYFLFLTLSKLDFLQIISQLHLVNLNWIFGAVIILVVDYALRIIRWWLMFRSTEFKPPFWLCCRFFLIGNALNNFLPLRAGDIYRIVEFSNQSRIPSSTVFATVAVERIFDVSSLLILLYLGISGDVGNIIFSNFPTEIQDAIKLLTISCFILVLSLLLLPSQIKKMLEFLIKYISIPSKIYNFIFSTLVSIQNLLSLSRVTYLIIFSIFVWFIEALAYGAIQSSLSLELPINAMLISNTFATISTLFPSSPGYIGTFHYFAALSLSVFGVSAIVAASFAIVMHSLLWVTVSSFGFMAYLVAYLNRNTKKI